jgi:formylglycine-generating enzyme
MFWARCLLAPVFGGESKADMVFVPGGLFRMGSDGHYPEEGPAHQVSIDGFWIDRTPVTNRQFKKFVRSESGNAITSPALPAGYFFKDKIKAAISSTAVRLSASFAMFGCGDRMRWARRSPLKPGD